MTITLDALRTLISDLDERRIAALLGESDESFETLDAQRSIAVRDFERLQLNPGAVLVGRY